MSEKSPPMSRLVSNAALRDSPVCIFVVVRDRGTDSLRTGRGIYNPDGTGVEGRSIFVVIGVS